MVILMFKREKCRSVKVGNLVIGGNDQVIIQSMCNVKTSNVKDVVSQIKELKKYGCELVRVSVLDQEDALAIKKIKEQVDINLIADIHFDYQLALLSIESKVDKIRINPGNIGKKENIKKVVEACKKNHIPIRIGINSGSLEKDLQQKYGISAKAMIESAKRHIQILNDEGFYDIILSLKSSSFEISKQAYLMASELFDYPLHLGITETGPLIPGIIKSTLGLQELLSKDIGSTIRISLSSSPIEEVKVAKHLLALNHLYVMPELISCPTCGRTQINLLKYVEEIQDYLYQCNKKIKVALMGCIVNGPGEACDADIGIAGGKNCAVLFKKGKIIKTIKEEEIISTLISELKKES